MIKKIISGGQTGAGRAALDVALRLGIPHGGWIPKGRIAEDGPLSGTSNKDLDLIHNKNNRSIHTP